jgi:hypothetical protein
LPYWRLRFDGARRLPALAEEPTALARGNEDAAASLPSAPLQAAVEP